MFLLGWITLGVMSALDKADILGEVAFKDGEVPGEVTAFFWILCMAGPVTIILSQKILFGARKMGTAWEGSGMPNFHPMVYNMGGPLFAWGWFMLFVGICGYPVNTEAL